MDLTPLASDPIVAIIAAPQLHIIAGLTAGRAKSFNPAYSTAQTVSRANT